MRLPQRHLEILEHALFDDGEIGRRRGRAVVVVADGGEPAFLRAVGPYRHQFGAKAQTAEHGGLDERRAGEIRLPAERAVEFGGVSDRLVDG